MRRLRACFWCRGSIFRACWSRVWIKVSSAKNTSFMLVMCILTTMGKVRFVEQSIRKRTQATRCLLVAITIGRSVRALLVAIDSCRNFEFTVFNDKPGSLVALWAISQFSNDIRIEVSLEIMFRTVRNARLSLRPRELFIQIGEWLTGYAMLV